MLPCAKLQATRTKQGYHNSRCATNTLRRHDCSINITTLDCPQTIENLSPNPKKDNMPAATMRTAVLQATAVYLLSDILHHYLDSDILDEFINNEGVQNFTAVLDRTTSVIAASASAPPSPLTLDASNTRSQTLSLSNTTLPNNGTQIANHNPSGASYSWSLLRRVVLCMLISVLQYHWFIWLERVLPARPRRKDGSHSLEGESDDREEEVVKKWIAQGRVNRASFNWCNTFFKWVLNLTVGRLLYHSFEHVLEVCVKLQSPKLILGGLTTVDVFSSDHYSLYELRTDVNFSTWPRASSAYTSPSYHWLVP